VLLASAALLRLSEPSPKLHSSKELP
jgi:hypothetical protein